MTDRSIYLISRNILMVVDGAKPSAKICDIPNLPVVSQKLQANKQVAIYKHVDQQMHEHAQLSVLSVV